MHRRNIDPEFEEHWDADYFGVFDNMPAKDAIEAVAKAMDKVADRMAEEEATT